MTTFEQQLRNSLSHAYDIERELGGGGMSRVFVATEKSLGRKVVIKLLSPELTADVNRGRFRREIMVAAQLQHPHIVTVLSAGEDGDLVYYTMPFIRGESLKSALEAGGAMSIEEVVRTLYDVVDALAYAHDNGVVHRDIKPGNILRSGAHALVTDFGVAKALNAAMPSGAMTSTGMAIGTPAYMSPEQLAGDPAADHRIDIYALGLLAYELLAGKSPFAAGSPREVLAAVLMREPPPLVEVRPDVPRRLSEMVMSCLSKDPDGRPPSAGALIAALDMFSTSSGEIRTREYRVPAAKPTGAVTTHGTPAGDPAVSGSSAVASGGSSGAFHQPTISVGGNTAPDPIPTYDPSRPHTNWNKIVMGGVAVLLPAAAAVFLMSQRTDEKASTGAAPSVNAAVVDSASQQQDPRAAIPESAVTVAVAVAVVDSQAIADSARRRAARAEKAKQLAAARADSQRLKAEQDRVRTARRAAAALLADAEARKSFMRGASHKGGLLGTQRRGDLQTQIDALQPFLANAGLTYDQFKRIVEESGFSMFDEFGRILPGVLQLFAASTQLE